MVKEQKQISNTAKIGLSLMAMGSTIAGACIMSIVGLILLAIIPPVGIIVLIIVGISVLLSILMFIMTVFAAMMPKN